MSPTRLPDATGAGGANGQPVFGGIHLDGVTLRRAGKIVFDCLDLRLSESRIGLIGDNGAGKSSLFRLICGLERPERGTVAIDSAGPPRRRAVGMMFQSPDDQIVFPIVEEELALGLTGQGLSRTQALSRARAFLAERGLGQWSTCAVASLSQGQRQQVCWLGLCLAGHRVLLLDEPYASLDLLSQAQLRADIDALGADVQIILSTHSLEHVQDFPRVIWLESGRVRADGPGDRVCSDYLRDVHMRSTRGARANPQARSTR